MDESFVYSIMICCYHSSVYVLLDLYNTGWKVFSYMQECPFHLEMFGFGKYQQKQTLHSLHISNSDNKFGFQEKTLIVEL